MRENVLRDAAATDTVRLGYRRARALTAEHGRTYFAASCLLPPRQRRGVWALYGFARIVDDVVDLPSAAPAPRGRAAQIDRIEEALHAVLHPAPDGRPVAGLDHRPEDAEQGDAHLESILAAVRDTVVRFDIPTHTFDAFLRSMRMDVPGTTEFRDRYRTWAELAEYTYGSAAVIGLQMIPLLGVRAAGDDVADGAATLGEAFQLTNFLRDVAEDLDRDRIYLPTDELAAFGVDEDHLRRCRAEHVTSPHLRRALAHMIAVNRDQYRRAWPSITALPNRSRRSIAAAAAMYHDILGEIERADNDVMDRRVVVSGRRRAMLAAQAISGRRPW
ncbi:phytoene/squalene synthase family protein [Gordonia sp. SL306]|uniref:phytoene/squalene synthase family protein n=1 Tax=Gordonia sp. SL306 TaxID=2995145 RepID=UPI00226FB11F|nr:phytoene/squalene synthase family protein [Gordonia sp. SL306]WAC55865.1 phytoene/squalene synthase family protein [Gordonia sp. SL306]